MKKTTILLFILISLLGFTSCQEDETGPVINSKAEDGSLTFHLNQTRLSNWTYVLEIANANNEMDALTCVQPDYGFTAAVTYTTQICLNSAFAEGTYQSLATTVNGEKVGISTKEINKAFIVLYGKLPNPVVEKDVYVRLKAVVSDATSTPLDKTPTVKPLYSNAVVLKIIPYELPLFPYTEVTTKPYYLVGVGNKWDNSVAGLGSSLIPLSLSAGKKYDLNGAGEFTYTGYFKATDEFKFIRDITSWTEYWGMTGTELTHNTGGNIKVTADGYYTVTLNSIDNTLTIVAAAKDPIDHTAKGIGMIGNITLWNSDIALTPAFATNNHVWYTTYTFTTEASAASDGGVKFRELGNWDVSWGNAAFPAAIGNPGGANSMYTLGTYIVIFNDVDGCYYFIKK